MTYRSERRPVAGFPWLTFGVCLACVVLHLALTARADSSAAPLEEQLALLEFGAKSAALVRDAGESWRILSFHLVHTGWLHLIFNLAFFFPASGALEAVCHRSDVLALLAVAAAVSGLASLLLTPEVSAGASGLVFAALAASTTFGLRWGPRLSPTLRMHFGAWVLPFLMLVLVVGAGNIYADHASHIGGLLTGLALGPWLRPRATILGLAPGEAQRERRRSLAVAVLAIAIPCAACQAARPLLVGPGAPDRTRWSLGEATSLSLPAGWEARYGTLGTLEFQTASGLVVLGIERIQTALDQRALAEWYVTHRLKPLEEAGLIGGLRPEGQLPRTTASVEVSTWRFAYVGPAGPTLRDVSFMALGDGTHTVVSLELPAAWSEKYAETRLLVLGSMTGTLSAPTVTHAQAAALP